MRCKLTKHDNYEFDEQAFVEHFLIDYNCQEIGDIDDICCVLDREYEDHDKIVRLAKAGYFNMTDDELRKELRTLERKVLQQAFVDYLNTYYKDINTNN